MTALITATGFTVQVSRRRLKPSQTNPVVVKAKVIRLRRSSSQVTADGKPSSEQRIQPPKAAHAIFGVILLLLIATDCLKPARTSQIEQTRQFLFTVFARRSDKVRAGIRNSNHGRTE